MSWGTWAASHCLFSPFVSFDGYSLRHISVACSTGRTSWGTRAQGPSSTGCRTTPHCGRWSSGAITTPVLVPPPVLCAVRMLCSVKQAAQKHYKRIALAQHGPADPFVHKVPPVYSSEGSKRNVHTALRTIEYTALCTVFLSIQEYCTQRRAGRKGEGSHVP